MLNISDFVKPNTGKDVADAVQGVIDTHPNRTICFPDGEYLLSKPITTPAHHERSVSLKLADFAVLRASADFRDTEAVVHYDRSVGFQNDAPWGNFFDFCYSDQFATGFFTDSYAVYQNCWAYWYQGTEKEARHVGFASSRPFEGRLCTATVSGHAHPDHPIRFFDVPAFHARAYLSNLVLGEDPYQI